MRISIWLHYLKTARNILCVWVKQYESYSHTVWVCMSLYDSYVGLIRFSTFATVHLIVHHFPTSKLKVIMSQNRLSFFPTTIDCNIKYTLTRFKLFHYLLTISSLHPYSLLESELNRTKTPTMNLVIVGSSSSLFPSFFGHCMVQV